ncbi:MULTISPECIES: hypothetical protein [unclassified Haladaptatus]|uniref:DUF7577 domain-containing protein n=1 Tax=unclassified Haladaptatus TaxID=2622732 RepID=UPI0023E8BB32|nr:MULTISPECIES: hypothetical protein [unclassified Haladaptatus]
MLDAWGWVVAYIIGFTVIHLLVYQYLRTSDESRFEQFSPSDASGYEGSSATADYGTQSGHVPGEFRQCPHCGTQNEADPVFVFCKECIQPLSV